MDSLPGVWVESIHPGDRDCVLKAAMAASKTGIYDEQYRIVRPNGAIRWVRDKHGTGLGLAMVYGIVQRHHGTIHIESKVGEGSLIRVGLPFTQCRG